MSPAGNDDAGRIVDAIRAVDWGNLSHAYGNGSDVEGQLIAVATGDDRARKEAWWHLWGNIHHQGTTYEATVPAVPIIGGLAAWRDYPDRVQAIAFLREVLEADGARPVARSLLDSWADEAEPVRRGLLWLLSALPECHDEFAALIDQELPDRFRDAWLVLARGPESQEEFDEMDAFEQWCLAGAEPE